MFIIKLEPDGHVSPVKLRDHGPPKCNVHWNISDYRAPDNEETLAVTTKSHTGPSASSSSVLPSSKTTPATLQPRLLQSYIWENNSCYFDVGLELWFRAYAQCSLESQQEFLNTFHPRSTLYKIFHHYQCRYSWIQSTSSIDVRSMFELVQSQVRDAIVSKYALYTNGEWGCPSIWMKCLLSVCIVFYIQSDLSNRFCRMKPLSSKTKSCLPYDTYLIGSVRLDMSLIHMHTTGINWTAALLIFSKFFHKEAPKFHLQNMSSTSYLARMVQQLLDTKSGTTPSISSFAM